MFYLADKRNITDFDPTEEQSYDFLFQMPRWAYTSQEWVRIVMKRTKLCGLIEWKEISYKKEVEYGLVYTNITQELVFGV